MKHVGKMKNNSARVAVVFRTLPGEPHSALVVGTQGLGDSYHDTLMTILESDSGQQANELADILSVRRFPDGSNMLGHLHANGHLVKVKTSQINMTPDPHTNISLDQLNQMIADQKGIALEDLAVNDGTTKTQEAQKKKKSEKANSKKDTPVAEEFELSPAELRSRADALFKQAQLLRKQADDLDPPKAKKAKTEKVIAE
jgi:hypothetical protein